MKIPELLSVIVSTYNQAEILCWLLNSLERQDYEGGFEVIVCDDGSDFNTLMTLKDFSDGNKLDIRYIWQPDRNFRIARSRNNAIRCAQGELLVFIDGDVVVPSDFLSRHVSAHTSQAELSIIAGCRRWVEIDFPKITINTLGDLELYGRNFGYDLDKISQKDLELSSLPWMACNGFCVSLPKQLEVNYDERFIGWGMEDYELFCRLYHRHQYSVKLYPGIEVLHIITLGHSKSNPWATNKHDHIATYVENSVYFKRKYPDIDLAPAMWPLTYFVLDESEKRWRRAINGEAVPLTQAIAEAEAWVDAYSK